MYTCDHTTARSCACSPQSFGQFVKKAEIIQKEGGIGGGEGTAMTAADSSTPTFGYSNSIKKKIKDNLQFKSEDGVEGILNIVKSVGEEFFGGK